MNSGRNINYRRFGLQAAFWFVMSLLLMTVLINFVNLSNTNQLSAYDDDWDDMSAFRADLKAAESKPVPWSAARCCSLTSKIHATPPTSLLELRRDTLSLPQFDEDGFITIAADDGYSPSEIDAIVEFVEAGGTALVLDDYGFAGTIAEAFGVRYTGYQLYDTTYVPELDYNFVWMCVQATPCGMNGTGHRPSTVSVHDRWSGNLGEGEHPVQHPERSINGTRRCRTVRPTLERW